MIENVFSHMSIASSSDTLLLPALAGLIGYFLRAFVKPTKIEVKILSNILAFTIMALIRLTRYYAKNHRDVVTKQLDKIYSKVFHVKESNDSSKLILG